MSEAEATETGEVPAGDPNDGLSEQGIVMQEKVEEEVKGEELPTKDRRESLS